MSPEERAVWSIEWTSPAKRALQRLPEKVATAAVEFIYGPLAEEPRRIGRPLRLEPEGRYSAHRGDHRIIYRVVDDRKAVVMEAIPHRSDAYRPN
ncbi:MAG TPA: type II toxin-antitoxin system RelE/ParE family toxin [Actinomycetota bacterium]|nr:type II toxin-antitoxin system RelE/ParE family toxin [Actinomycetota bacterium]